MPPYLLANGLFLCHRTVKATRWHVARFILWEIVSSWLFPETETAEEEAITTPSTSKHSLDTCDAFVDLLFSLPLAAGKPTFSPFRKRQTSMVQSSTNQRILLLWAVFSTVALHPPSTSPLSTTSILFNWPALGFTTVSRPWFLDLQNAHYGCIPSG